MLIGELGECFEWLRAATAGWRFLFSPSYRHAVIQGWRAARWFYVAWDIVCGIAGVVLSLAILICLGFIIRKLFTP